MKNFLHQTSNVVFVTTSKVRSILQSTAVLLILSLVCSNGIVAQIYTTVTNGNTLTYSGGGPYTLTSLTIQDGGAVNFLNCTVNIIPSGTAGVAEIEVEAGGILTLENCTLKVNTGSTSWYGIRGTGHSNQDQYTSYPIDPSFSYSGSSSILNMGQGKQSYIEIKNCVIYDMTWGIQSVSGCILSASGTKFYDNCNSILIDNYLNPNTGNQPNGDYYNACTISDCSFEWIASPASSKFGYSTWYDYQFIWLSDISGVHIQGCHFKNVANNNANTLYCEDRGVAIYSDEASYSVHKSGTPSVNSDGCTEYNGNVTSFEGTSYGVYAAGVTLDFTVSINLCTFDKHYRAIYTYYGSKHTIGQNTFTSANSSKYPPSVPVIGGPPQTGCDNDITFITLENSKNCVVYWNYLTYTKIAAPVTSTLTGAKLIECISLGSTTTTSIYKNFLSTPGGSSALYSKHLYGMHFSGDCAGTSAKCNTFNDMKKDFYLDNSSSANMEFGTSSLASGNVFSANADKHIENLGTGSINYYYYNLGLQIPNIAKVISANRISSSFEGCPPYTCTVWPASINEPLANSNTISVYPNPANTLLNLDFTNNHPKGFSIYDQTGKLIYTLYSNNTTEQIDISSWSAGVYFVHLNGGGSGVKFTIAR